MTDTKDAICEVKEESTSFKGRLARVASYFVNYRSILPFLVVFWWYEKKTVTFPGIPAKEAITDYLCPHIYPDFADVHYFEDGAVIECHEGHWLPESWKFIRCTEDSTWETEVSTHCYSQLCTLLAVIYVGFSLLAFVVCAYYRIKDIKKYNRSWYELSYFESKEKYLEYKGHDVRRYIEMFGEILSWVFLLFNTVLGVHSIYLHGLDTVDENLGRRDIFSDARFIIPLFQEFGAMTRILNCCAQKHVTPFGFMCFFTFSAGAAFSDVVQNHLLMVNYGSLEAFNWQIWWGRAFAFPLLVYEAFLIFNQQPFSQTMAITIGILGGASAERQGSTLFGFHRSAWLPHYLSQTAFEFAFYDRNYALPSFWISSIENVDED